MIRHGLKPMLLAVCLPVAASAKTYCVFQTECFEAEACAESTFRLDFEGGGSAGGTRLSNGVVAETEFGDLPGYVIRQSEGAATYAFETGSAMYFLSFEGRDARLSVHMEGPMVVGYLGTCEDLG